MFRERTWRFRWSSEKNILLVKYKSVVNLKFTIKKYRLTLKCRKDCFALFFSILSLQFLQGTVKTPCVRKSKKTLKVAVSNLAQLWRGRRHQTETSSKTFLHVFTRSSETFQSVGSRSEFFYLRAENICMVDLCSHRNMFQFLGRTRQKTIYYSRLLLFFSENEFSAFLKTSVILTLEPHRARNISVYITLYGSYI